MPDQQKSLPIVAETTGTLWKIVASPGVAQTRDSTLAIIESMKMEIPVEAPADGYIAEYHVAEGDPVEEGQVLGSFVPAQ